MSRRAILTALIVVLVLGSLAACASAPLPTRMPTPKSSANEPVATAAGVATAEPVRTYRVGLVCGPLGDGSLSDSAARGMQWVNQRLPNVKTQVSTNASLGEQQLAVRSMAQEGYDLVITLGANSADWTTQIARAYPNVKFALVDASLDLPNGTGLVFKDNEGAFTVGMLAALLSQSGKLGFIGSLDTPTLRRSEKGFSDGIKYANPGLQLLSAWVGADNDPAKANQLALSLFDQGCDIIFADAAQSTPGVIQAAKDKDLFAIAAGSDQCSTAPGNVIASMVRMADIAVFSTVQSLSQGKLQPGNRAFGLQDNAIGLCWLYDLDQQFKNYGPAYMTARIPDVLAKVQAAVQSIQAGSMCVEDHLHIFPCDKPAQPGGMGG